MGTARTHGIHHASEEHQSRALGSSARNASNSTTLAAFRAADKKGLDTAARMTFFFTDHPFLGLGLVALILGHGVALAWWIKQAMKPMARGSGDPWLLQKNK